MVDVFIGKLAYAYLEVLETYGNTLLPKEKKNFGQILEKKWPHRWSTEGYFHIGKCTSPHMNYLGVVL